MSRTLPFLYSSLTAWQLGGRKIFLPLVLEVLLLALVQGNARSQTFSPQKVFGRYQQFAWLEQHGLPQNTVQAITRTRDGYLWLGTLAGLARFDGAHFTVFDNSNTPEIRASYITSLLEDQQRHLWLGADGGGLIRFQDGRFSVFTTQDGLPNDTTKALSEDGEGGLWVGTYGGLVRFKDGRFTTYTTRDGLPSNTITALQLDRNGVLWIGTASGLVRFKDGRFTVYTTRDGLPHHGVKTLHVDHSGDLWIGVDTGLCRFKDGQFTVHGVQDGLTNLEVFAIAQDREGNLWVGTIGGGLFRLAAQSADGRFARYRAKDGLPGDRVVAIYQDPQGDVWIGTDGGLSQLRDGRFQVYGMLEGLTQEFAHGVYEDRAGNLWVGTTNGLNRFKDGKISRYTAKDGVPTYPIMSIREDRAGNLWLGTLGGGLARFQHGRFTTWTTKDGLASNLVRAVLEDGAGNLWVGTYGNGLNLFRDGRFTTYTARDGLASNYVRTLFEDRIGNLWIGTEDGGLSRFKDGRFTTWTSRDGLANNFVVSFYEDRVGGLWIGTVDGGLSRFKDGKFATITAKDGLFDNVAFQILSDTDDDSGNLWMSCNKGIYRASLRELNDFADGRLRSVTSFGYGVTDGMLSRECNSGSPAGWKARDGRLWFPSTRGVVVIDPRKRNTQPPLLALEKITLDRVTLPSDQAITIRPGQENLEIQYAGLSWGRPQQIRFKYQLVGLDQTWVEAGTRRTAYFPHLPPGDYTFKLVADNGDGVWNEAGAQIRISVLPPFYRTWWFNLLALSSVVALALVFYQARINQLRKAHVQQEAFSRRLLESQEAERKRIAAELHDSLGQNLLIIKNRALLGLAPKELPPPTREQLNEISSLSSQAIEEVREITYNLRPYQIDRMGLTRALESMVKRVALASGIQFSLEVAQLKGLFNKEAEINLYRVVQECVNNIAKHSGATEAKVIVTHQQQQVLLLIEDNGKGFAVEQTLSAETGKHGFGLLGLAERVRILGGVFNLRSAPGGGTTVSITIALQDNHYGH